MRTLATPSRLRSLYNRKGYGWLLKEASNFDEWSVFQFVMGHKLVMPRTALRYAIEKMPKNLREQAMKKS